MHTAVWNPAGQICITQFGKEQMKDTKPLTTGKRQGGGLWRHKSESIS